MSAADRAIAPTPGRPTLRSARVMASFAPATSSAFRPATTSERMPVTTGRRGRGCVAPADALLAAGPGGDQHQGGLVPGQGAVGLRRVGGHHVHGGVQAFHRGLPHGTSATGPGTAGSAAAAVVAAPDHAHPPGSSRGARSPGRWPHTGFPVPLLPALRAAKPRDGQTPDPYLGSAKPRAVGRSLGWGCGNHPLTRFGPRGMFGRRFQGQPGVGGLAPAAVTHDQLEVRRWHRSHPRLWSSGSPTGASTPSSASRATASTGSWRACGGTRTGSGSCWSTTRKRPRSWRPPTPRPPGRSASAWPPRDPAASTC